MALEAGTRLGHYEVVSSLGAGGMGEVYRAKDTKLGREVAVKLLLDEVSSAFLPRLAAGDVRLLNAELGLRSRRRLAALSKS